MTNPTRATTDRRRSAAVTALAVTGGLLAGCGGVSDRPQAATSGDPADAALPQGDEPVELDPADFSVDISHPWWPMTPGDRWIYRETDADGSTATVEVTVLDETRTIANGIEARVVHDRVTDQDGAVVEDTADWYAEDADGNVWYLGEETAEYEDGEVVSTEGSWEAGVAGAQPGILLPAEPAAGMAYRQEFLAGTAEDEAVVLSVDEMVETPTGAWTGALLTRDTTPVEPGVAELKFYAPDVGPVLVLQVAGGESREVLVGFTRAG